ncbi:hypothetical protein VPH35_043681 [Triticum aestivum]
MNRLLLCDPARRPRESHRVIVATPALELEEHVLRQHAVTLTAADRSHSTTPAAVGRVIFEQLSTGPHQLRVMAHQPEAFLIHFDLPAHRDNAVRRAVIKVDGCKYFIRVWNEDDHTAILKFNHHVRVVIEDLPMQFWNLPGAEEALGDIGRVDRLDSRTLERGHTKTFACWLWVWDVARIPTRRALWVLKRGAGCSDEIIGITPDDRRVPPPPGAHRYDMLIHVDLLEDWSPLSPRSSHSGQSGLPSSDDSDDRPLPRVEPGTWVAHVEDGQGRARSSAPRAGPAGCGPILGGSDRDRNGDGGSGGSSRSWRDWLLGHGCHARSGGDGVVNSVHRQRSRTPVGSRRSVGRKEEGSSSNTNTLRATPPKPLRPVQAAPAEADPVAQFFSFSDSGRALSPPPRMDCMQLEMENAMIKALRTSLAFEDGGRSPPSRLSVKPGELESPAMLPCLLPCVSSPVAATVGFQLDAVTQQVGEMVIGSRNEQAAQLFEAVPAPILPCQPPRPRHPAPPKSRALSAPSRRSARQAAAGITTLVAQRAVLCLIQELGELGPKDKMTPKAAAQIMKRFQEPLSEGDIAAIAKLTSLDQGALKTASGMAGLADAEEILQV